MDILMFIRILTVYPLLTYFIRCQNFIVFSGTEWPGYPKVAMVNFFIVALGYFCATFYDKVMFFFLTRVDDDIFVDRKYHPIQW